jgi:tetratricopeptide (TPR) repeat protein
MAPTLETLTARFLARQSISPEGVEIQEVEPHDVLTGFRASAASTWKDATAALALFETGAVLGLPPEWAAFVAGLNDISILPLSIGAVPQRVRAIGATPTVDNQTSHGSFSKLRQWIAVRKAGTTAIDKIIAGAMLRTMGDFAEAETCFAAAAKLSDCPHDLLANERATLKWYRGDVAGALAMWDAMPDSPVASFNRGVAQWVLGRNDQAAPAFANAANRLPDSTGWSHLAGMAMLMCE